MSKASFPNIGFLNHLRHCVLILDSEKKVCYANESAAHLLEIDRNDYASFTLNDKISFVDQNNPNTPDQNVLINLPDKAQLFSAIKIQHNNTPYWLLEQLDSKTVDQEKLMAKNLRESEARFRAIVEQSSEGLILFDELGKITLWNKGEEAITGYKAEEMIGQYIWDVMFMLGTKASKQKSPHGATTIRKRIINLLEQKNNRWIHEQKEHLLSKKNGTERVVQTTLFPVFF